MNRNNLAWLLFFAKPQTLCLVCMTLAQVNLQGNESWYDQKLEGWYYFEDSKPTQEKEPAIKAKTPEEAAKLAEQEKQKLKAVYGMLSDKQVLRYFHESVKKEGNAAHLLLQRLECRLDNIVYKLKFASTIFQAQQMVAHGHILVNGKKVDVRSFLVKPGMTISVKEKSKNMKGLKECVENTSRTVPEYLSLDEKNFSGELLSTPEADQIVLPLPINIALVCEFLAHTH